MTERERERIHRNWVNESVDANSICLCGNIGLS